MAGIKHTYTLAIKNDAGANVLANSTVITADAEENFNITVPPAATVEVDLDITVLNILSFFVESDKAVLFETNASVNVMSGTPDNSFNLAAGVALWWNTSRPSTNPADVNPLDTNITKLFFTNAGVVAATVKGGFLISA